MIRLYAALPRPRREVQVVGHQLLRSGTSVAAHVREASRARSREEFCSKLEVAIQEADESALWLELLREDCEIRHPEIPRLEKETDELIAILVTVVRNSRLKAGD